MPDARQCLSKSGETLDLSPPRKPPPWMKTTSGVGPSAFAFHRSMTLRSCGPYFAFLTSGAGLPFSAGFGSCAGAGRHTAAHRARAVRQDRVGRLMAVLLLQGPADGIRSGWPGWSL